MMIIIIIITTKTTIIIIIIPPPPSSQLLILLLNLSGTYCELDTSSVTYTCNFLSIKCQLKEALAVASRIIESHSLCFAGRAAYQRTVNLGKRFLLEWCCSEIPNSTVDPRGPFLDL